MLNRDEHVQACVMFGRSKFQAGVLIHPKPEFAFDSDNEEKLSEFRNVVWSVSSLYCGARFKDANRFSICRPTVERMNAHAPQHSRLFKEVGAVITSWVFQELSAVIR